MATCPDGRCDGSGFLFDEAARTARPCSCRPKLLARKRAAAIEGRIPKRYRGVGFDRAPLPELAQTNPEVVRRVRRYVQTIDEQVDSGRGIWFSGPTGTGKTTLAMLISKAAIEAGRAVAIYSLPHLLALLRDTYQDDGPNLVDLIERLATIELLHIDDIGAEQSSPWVLEQLYTIINARYEDERALILTTNLPTGVPSHERPPPLGDGPPEPPVLYDQLGERIVSRILQICGEPLVVGGADHRRAAEIDQDDVEIDYSAVSPPAPPGGLLGGWDAGDAPAYGEPRPPRFAS